MANQILAGAVIQAGMVIAGVDANNPPVTSSGSSGSGDQYWDNVTLLLRQDPNSNDVIDVSSFSTEVSEYDSLVWDSSKPGDAWGDSLYANSTQQDQRVWNNSFGSGVQFGTEDYTIDFWVKTNHLDMITLFDQNTSSNGGFVFRLSWGKIFYGENSGLQNTSYHQHHHGTTALSDGEWHYIAIARESGVTRIWADGALEVEFASSMNFQQEGFSLNTGVTSTAPRWVNDFRITKGVARYTGSDSIDVPTEPHPTSSGSEEPAPSSGDPFPYSGDFVQALPDGQFVNSVTSASSYDHLADWVTYGVTANETHGAWGPYPRIVPQGESPGSVHFMRYDPASGRIYAVVSYETSFQETLEAAGMPWDTWGWDNTLNNFTAVASVGSYFPVIIQRTLNEADLGSLNLQWDADGGVNSTGSWVIPSEESEETPSTTATPTNVIVGSMWSEGTGSGSAAIYDITTGSQTLKVTQPPAIQSQYANFGKFVAANSTKFAVGAPSEVINGNVQNGGEVIVYDIDGSNPVSITYADNVDTSSGDEFGDALAISDNYVWTGIWKGESSGRSGRGQLTRHNLDGSLASVIDGPVNVDNAFFGKQVAWSGTHVVCTAPGPNGFSGNYSDGYFAVYTEDGTLVETVTLAGSKGNLFGDRINVTDASCTSNKVVLRDKNSKVYLYDLDAADIAGSMVMVANNPNATTLGLAVNDDYVYVGLSESGQTDTIKVYSHDGTHQFDITPSAEVLSGAGNPANHLQQFGVNIEATNNHIFTTVTSSGDLVVLDASGNHVTSIDTNGGSYSGYWTGGIQFFA